MDGRSASLTRGAGLSWQFRRVFQQQVNVRTTHRTPEPGPPTLAHSRRSGAVAPSASITHRQRQTESRRGALTGRLPPRPRSHHPAPPKGSTTPAPRPAAEPQPPSLPHLAPGRCDAAPPAPLPQLPHHSQVVSALCLPGAPSGGSPARQGPAAGEARQAAAERQARPTRLPPPREPAAGALHPMAVAWPPSQPR